MMKRILLFLCCYLFSFQTAMCLESTENKSLERAMYAADHLQKKGLHLQALSELLVQQEKIKKAQASKKKVYSDQLYVQFVSQLGDLHLQLHHWEKAAILLSEAVVLARDMEQPPLLASTLNNFANLAAIAGEDAYAHAAFQESIDLSTGVKGQHPILLQAMMNQARLLWKEKEQLESENKLKTMLVLLQSDLRFSARQLLALSRLVHQIRQTEKSGEDWFLAEHQVLNMALKAAKSGSQATSLSQAYGYLAALYEEDKNVKDALKLNQRAVFFAQQEASAELLYRWQWQYARLLMMQGQLLEAIDAYQKSIHTLNPIRTALLKGLRKAESPFNTHIRPVYMELADALLQQAELESEAVDKQELLRQARSSIENMKSLEIQDYLSSDCIDLSNSQQALLDNVDQQTAIIYPVVLKDRLVMLLGIGDQISQWSQPIPQEKLDKTVKLFREHLQTRSNNLFLYEAQQLDNWLIKPLLSQLKKHQINTLVFVPDGSLRMVPMTALHDGDRYLIQRFALATTPGLTLTNPHPMNKKNIKALVLGLSDAVQNFSELPSIAKEVSAVSAMFGADLLENKQFKTKNLQEKLESNEYNLLHLATHGVFSGEPETSYVLTYDEKINMNRLQELIALGRYNREPLELLTLSACQTAMGNERAAMGLAGIAIQAGARSALASLWFVDDEATSQLIRRFYKKLQQEGVSKAKALQTAQLALIQQDRFWHPAYWGAFILIGNWL
ncbi:MAG: CHAT domain-containing protein [Mariprofundaceae bacterium]|nr:CHAT domain-containing protein [Mariprofundaceae bacterium]